MADPVDKITMIQEVLKQKLLELQVKNPRLSNRYFAQKLGISSGALSEILQGKRNVSKKLAAKLADRLQLDPSQTAQVLGEPDPTDSEAHIEFMRLQDDQFHLIADWPHFAILNLVKSDICVHKPSWFAQQLNLPLKTIHHCLERLLRLEMLVFENKKYIRKAPNFATSDDILNLSMRKSNMEDLEMIRDHILSELSVHERDLTSVVMLIDPKKMPDVKKWVRKMQDQFAHKFETTRNGYPFRLTMALFPLKKPQS